MCLQVKLWRVAAEGSEMELDSQLEQVLEAILQQMEELSFGEAKEDAWVEAVQHQVVAVKLDVT